MSTIKHFLEFIVNPFFLLVLALISCCWLLKNNKKTNAVRSVLIALCGVLVLLSTGWLPRALTYSLEDAYPLVHDINPAIKWVVVLGGGHSERPNMPANDLLAQASLKRLIEGVRLERELPHAQLVLSGGGDSVAFSEAHLMHQLTAWFAVPEHKIILEADSQNTAQQALALKAIVGDEPFYLVTSAVHMPRSMWLCEQQGLHPIAAPTDFTLFWQMSDHQAKLFIPNAYNIYYFNVAFHEWLGRLWAKIH